MDKNFYEILGVPLDAKPTEIEMAFHNLDALYHPAVEKDLSRKEKNTQEKEFAAIKQAYETLINSDSKRQYDLSIKNTESNDIENENLNQETSDKNNETTTDKNNDQASNSVSNEETTPTKYKEINFSINSPSLKILFPNITRPIIWFIVFLLCMFCINHFKDFSHKYTLVSELLTDTTYYTQTSNGPKKHVVKKGEKVEVISNIPNEKFIETNLGKLPKENLSSPQNGYFIRSWADIYKTLFPILITITLNLFLLRIIAASRAIYVNNNYKQPLNLNDIIYCTKKEASIIKACLIIPLAYGIMILIREQLDALALSYAFSSGNNPLLNYILECYQEHPKTFIFLLFVIPDIIMGYILILWSFNKYKCPYCQAPFSFFIIKTYDTDINTYNKTEYREEQRNGRTVKVPYIVAYKNYNHHVIRQCNICEECKHSIIERTDKI